MAKDSGSGKSTLPSLRMATLSLYGREETGVMQALPWFWRAISSYRVRQKMSGQCVTYWYVTGWKSPQCFLRISPSWPNYRPKAPSNTIILRVNISTYGFGGDTIIKLMVRGERKWKWKLLSHVQLFVTPWNCPWNSPGQNTGVGSRFLSRESSQPRDQTQVSCIAGGFFTSWAQGSPRTLEGIAYPFSRGSSRLRSWTGVSCITGGFFTSWAIREVVPTY